MADPITLTGLAYWFLSSKAAEWILGNAAGNLTADAVKTLFKKTNLLWSKGELPQNEHLIKALRSAKLDATSLMVMTYSQHLKNRGEKEESDLLETAYSKWIKAEKNTIKNYPDFLKEDELYNKIELLLASGKSENIIEKRSAFILWVKDEFWKEFEYDLLKFNYAPNEELKNFLLNGWEIEGKVFDWFDVMTLYFGTTLKDPDNPGSSKAQTAFVDSMLSGIKAEQTLGFDLIKKALDELSPLKDIITKQHAQVEQWLNKIMSFVNPQPNLTYDYSDYEDLKTIKLFLKPGLYHCLAEKGNLCNCMNL